MIGSKLLPVASIAFRNGLKLGGQGQRLISTSSKRMGGHGPWTYREFPMPNKKHEMIAEAAGAFFWWWVFWHCFTDYGHLIGEFEYACAEDWTDEELGIPPDDAADPE